MDNKKIGVIIARFQVPDLHEGHKHLLSEVLTRHDRILILLGCAPIKLSENDPLNFETRKAMLQVYLKNYDVTVLPLYDKKSSDELWSSDVDKIIKETFYVNENGAILYGSRDSFIPHYKGVFKTIELEPKSMMSGTDSRKEATKEVLYSSDFRRGVIYATSDRFPLVYSCVDVAIMKGSDVLLGRKSTDPKGQYRFIGGFVDITDENDFAAARREAYEETGATVEPYNYICSKIIDDWRYAKEKNAKIMTRFIIASFVNGPVHAADDIEDVKWFNLGSLFESDLVVSHRPLLNELKDYWLKNSI